MRARGPRLGEILEQQGRLSRDQLLRALRNQKVVGGKLGTCLLEIDAVPEEMLLRALATQQGVESASPDELRGIAGEVLALVPAKVARVNFVVPFRASGTQIQVAMIDARDLRTLDELAFVTGRRVRPHVACEARLLEALEKHYGEEIPPRFVKLLDRLNRARFMWRAGEEAMPRDELPSDGDLGALGPMAASKPTWSSTAPVPASGATVGHATMAPAPPPPAPVPDATPTAAPALPSPAPQATPAGDFEEVERRLLEPNDVDAVGRALIDFVAGRALIAALFQARRSEIVGWLGRGVDPIRLGAYRLQLDRPSLFVALHEGAALHRGPLADLAAHSGLRVLLGDAAAADLVVFPLRVRDRLVAALLVAPAQGGLPAAALDELHRVVAKASIALELCIMRKKLQKA